MSSTMNPTRISLLVIGLFCLIFLPLGLGQTVPAGPALARGTNYHVSPVGSDTNPGTQAQPWSTIQHAAYVMQSGDTAFIHGGTYVEEIFLPRNGTAAQPITFKAVPGEQPVIDGTNAIESNIVLFNNSYIVFDGLRVQQPVNSWVRIENSAHITLQNMQFDNPTLRARAQGGIWMRYSQYNRVLNSTFDNWGQYPNGDNLGNAIFINNGPEGGYNLIEGNSFGHGANGDILVGSSYNIIRNNTFNNPWQKGLSVTHFVPGDEPPGTEWPALYNLVEGNQFIFSGNSEYGHGGYLFTNNASHTIFRRNTVRNGVYGGVLVGTFGGPVPHRNNHFYNNTIVNNGQKNKNGQGFELGVGLAASNNGATFRDLQQDIVKNNIIWGNLPNSNNNPFQLSLEIMGDANDPPYAGFTIAGNLIDNQRPGQCSPDSGDCPFIIVGSDPDTGNSATLNYLTSNFFGNLDGEPRFVRYDTAGSAFDLHLTATSDAVDRGVHLTNTTIAGSGTIVTVADSGYFHGTYNGMVTGDTIQVGSEIVSIVGIDPQTNQITIDRSIQWDSNIPVDLPYAGTSPDIGAYEYVVGQPALTPTPTPVPTAVPTPHMMYAPLLLRNSSGW